MNESDSFTNIENQIDEINSIIDIGINQVTLQSNKTASRYKPTASTYRTMKNELASIQNNINRLEQKLFASTTSTQSFPSNSIEQSNSSFYPSTDYKQKLAIKENEMIDIKMSLDEQLKSTEELINQISEKDRAIKEKDLLIQEQNNEINQLKGYKENAEKVGNDYHKLLQEFNKSEAIRKEQKTIIKALQKDIDNMRQESLNRINQIRYEKDLIELKNNHIITNKQNNDDIYSDIKTNKKNRRSKSPSNLTNQKERTKKCKARPKKTFTD